MIERTRYVGLLDRLSRSLFSIWLRCSHCEISPGAFVYITITIRLFGKSIDPNYGFIRGLVGGMLTGYYSIDLRICHSYRTALDIEGSIKDQLYNWLNMTRAIMEGKQGVVAIDLESFRDPNVMCWLREMLDDVARGSNVAFVIHAPSTNTRSHGWLEYLDRIGMTEAEWLEGL